MQHPFMKLAALCVAAVSFSAYAADPAAPKNTKPAAVDGISKEMKDAKGGKDKMGMSAAKSDGDKGGKGPKDKLGVNAMKSDGDKGDKGGKGGGKDKLGMTAMKSDGDKGDKGGKGGGKDKLGMTAMKSDGDKGGKGPKDKMGANHMMKDKDGGKGPKDKVMGGRDSAMQGAKARDSMAK